MNKLLNNNHFVYNTNVFYQVMPSMYEGIGNSRSPNAFGFRNHRRTDKQTLEELGVSQESSSFFFHSGVYT